jgi:hypothetical protein
MLQEIYEIINFLFEIRTSIWLIGWTYRWYKVYSCLLNILNETSKYHPNLPENMCFTLNNRTSSSSVVGSPEKHHSRLFATLSPPSITLKTILSPSWQRIWIEYTVADSSLTRSNWMRPLMSNFTRISTVYQCIWIWLNEFRGSLNLIAWLLRIHRSDWLTLKSSRIRFYEF